jgi:iron complex outermembrane receptor protein
MRLNRLALCFLTLGMGAHLGAQAQGTTGSGGDTAKLEKVVVTGSSIKRLRDEGSLPVQVFTRAEIDRAGISSAEQLVGLLTSNGNGVDNMASQSDVVAGDARGNNGASFANLRGQGSRNTLVLLNGRRVASHGLNGTAVNLNTIPMNAIERVEVLKDGASAIYGTDAIGGVINFITKKNLSGLQLEGFMDVPERKGGEVYGVKVSGGLGNLDKDGYNVLFAAAHTDNKILTGQQRDFVNTFQPDRGLSVDTRGTPIATVFAVGTTATVTNIFSPIAALGAAGPSSTGVLRPGDTVRYNGINTLDLPGGAGCGSMPNSAPYDDRLWNNPATAFGCAWDTGVSATLQQPVKNTSLVLRGSYKLGEHQISAELVGAKVNSYKAFSEVQLIGNNSTARYRITTANSSYNDVFNALVGAFPTLEGNRGRDIYFRWRCLPCGPREIETDTESRRFFLGADGPLPFADWDYRVGVSTGYSEDKSALRNGYYYRDGMVNILANGSLNPFTLTQTSAGLAALEGINARGLPLYGGKFEVKQADASASGPIMKLPGGTAMAAVGVDLRRETYRFRGLPAASAPGGIIIAAPFDESNSVDGKSRDVKAVYGELLMPVLKTVEATLAVRTDQYTGFGRTTNPKLAVRWFPSEQIMVRSSYSTGFRVPTFSQQLNGVTQSPFSGVSTLVDPEKCPSLVVSGLPGCTSISPDTIDGGNPNLQPEKANIASVGLAFSPTRDLRASIDWWSIELKDSMRKPGISELTRYYDLFKSRWVRDSGGNVTAIDQRWFNTGGSKTTGLEWEVEGQFRVGDGRWKANVNGTYLLSKKSRALDVLPYGPSEIGQFNRYGDPGIRWKHTATFSYTEGAWTSSLTQRYSSGYNDNVLPGVVAGRVSPPNWSPKVQPYTVYDVSVSYKGFKNMEVIAGIKNLLDDAPPFSAYYDDNLGSGSSWDPRVADPRMRSFNLRVRYNF